MVMSYIRYGILVLLCVVPLQAKESDNQQTRIVVDDAKEPRPDWYHRFIRSLALGVAVGTANGAVFGVIDRIATPLLWPLTWYTAHRARHAMTKSIIRNLEEDEVAYNADIIHEAAQISSWISWVYCMRLYFTNNVRFSYESIKK